MEIHELIGLVSELSASGYSQQELYKVAIEHVESHNDAMAVLNAADRHTVQVFDCAA